MGLTFIGEPKKFGGWTIQKSVDDFNNEKIIITLHRKYYEHENWQTIYAKPKEWERFKKEVENQVKKKMKEKIKELFKEL